jgi:hypothetical protein
MPMPSPSPWRWNRVCGGLVALVLIIGMRSAAVPQVPDPSGKTEQPADPLLRLNNASRLFYTLAKEQALAKNGPVLIVVGDDLVLRNGEKRMQAKVIPEIYHTLKTFDHVPLAIDVTLAAHAGETPFGEDLLNELRDYRSLFPAAGERIDRAGLDAEQRERQKTILAECARFVDSVLDKRQCLPDERVAFTRRMTPLLMANASAAARAALVSLHRQVCEWKGQLTPQEWSRLTVIVIGRQLPRKDNLAIQYFARLLGQPGEGKRIIYAEGLGDEPRALDLLSTHLVDTRVGIDFFNDPNRMARDLLSDGARDYLPLLIDQPR